MNGTGLLGGLRPPRSPGECRPWVEDAVRWITYVGVAEGFDDGTYRPANNTSRAQLVRMLHRVAGSPPVTGLPESSP